MSICPSACRYERAGLGNYRPWNAQIWHEAACVP